MNKPLRILTINPGSTSTKCGVYDMTEGAADPVMVRTIDHAHDPELARLEKIIDQKEYRKGLILEALRAAGIPPETIDVVVGRGGMIKPVPEGVFAVNDRMIEDLEHALGGEHPANLGGMLAREIARQIGPAIPAYILNPPVVDEYEDIARISGMPEIPRISRIHALNQKKIARTFAAEIGERYEDLNLIVLHAGGGISAGIHRKGRIIDSNNGFNGDGPFTPQRSGDVPVGQLIERIEEETLRLAREGRCTPDAVIDVVRHFKKMNIGEGGMKAYLGTEDIREVIRMIETGDAHARLIYEAMAYQIAKLIGGLATVVEGRVDAILLTGGMIHDMTYLVPWITRRVAFIAPVHLYPGEDELLALAEGGYRAAAGEVGVLVYE